MNKKAAPHLPMKGKLTKLRKGQWILDLKFIPSGRTYYANDIFFAANKRDALKKAKLVYPDAEIK